MENNRRLLRILLCISMPKLKNSNLYLYVKHFPARLGWGIDISHSDKSFTRFLLTWFFLAHLGLYSAYSWYNPMIISFMLKFQPRKSCVTFSGSHSSMFCFANEPRTCKIDLFLKICGCEYAYLGNIWVLATWAQSRWSLMGTNLEMARRPQSGWTSAVGGTGSTAENMVNIKLKTF